MTGAVIAALCIIAAPPILAGSSCAAIENGDENTIITQAYLDETELPYCSPEVADSIEFCGKMIDLTRYDRRERMDRELLAFTYMHSTSILMLKRANRYFPVVEPILKENGIPDDFKYLMVIESNMSPTARSTAGAAGLWQFMQAAGREYGLEVNANIDERYHVEKSTQAACRFLKTAYKKYGDWIAAAASYNAGQARIANQMTQQGVDDSLDLQLVEETARYVYRILAAKQMFANPAAFGFRLRASDLYPPIPCTEVTVRTGISNLANFARKKGITLAILKNMNPWLRESSLMNRSGRTYVLKIPTKEGMRYNPKETVPHDKRWVVE